MKAILDTSLLIASVDDEDPRRADAKGRLERSEAILIPPEVLAETLGLVHRRKGWNAAAHLLAALRAADNVVFMGRSEASIIAEVFSAGRGKLSWVDAAVVAACSRESAAPLAFDPAIEAAVRRASR